MYVVCARAGEISTSGLCCVISNFSVECGGMLWLEARQGLVASIEFEGSGCAGIVKWRVPLPSS